MAKIFLITHFPVSRPSGPNPNIIATLKLAQVNDILFRLPFGTSISAQMQGPEVRIICGTGLRHLRTAMALGLIPTHYSPCVGCPDLMLPDKKVLLADGSLIDEKDYSCFVDEPELCRSMIQPLTNGEKSSIIITDPYLVTALGGISPSQEKFFVILIVAKHQSHTLADYYKKQIVKSKAILSLLREMVFIIQKIIKTLV